MIARRLEQKLRQWSQQYPVITVTGPRQSGKTTLCRAVFSDKPYRSLEDFDVREFAREDPRGFLADLPDGAVIDEIQQVPELASYIQTEIDQAQRTGMYILTGSHQFEMMQTVSQSLAGRTAVARLMPFSYGELFSNAAPNSLNEMIFKGFYPRIHDKHLNPSEALSFYVSTYIERDVRQILAITDLRRFEIFLRLCAGRTGQLLNLQSLGNDCGVTHNTIKSWISVLQASGIIKLLSPWHANIGKRLIKSPKLYFLDTGLAVFLIGIRSADQLKTHPLRGAIFETFVIAEAYKQRCHAGLPDDLWFYRDSNGNEVDLLLETANGLHAWEIKSAATISTDFLKGLNALERAIGQIKRCLIYGGDQTFKRQNTQMLPWQNIDGQFLPHH